MAEKLDLSKEALQEAADLLSQLANPNGIKNPVPKPIQRPEPKIERPENPFHQFSNEPKQEKPAEDNVNNFNQPQTTQETYQQINSDIANEEKKEFQSNFSQQEPLNENITEQQENTEEHSQVFDVEQIEEKPKIENFEKKEINDNVRKDLLESVTMKPKPVTKGDPNVLLNQDQKKIEDLARSIFGGDGVRARK